jgi:hypothetical protein
MVRCNFVYWNYGMAFANADESDAATIKKADP